MFIDLNPSLADNGSHGVAGKGANQWAKPRPLDINATE